MLQELVKFFYGFAVVFSCIMLILFFKFQIWKIVGDFSGMNAKRGIKEISNQRSAEKHYSQSFLSMKLVQGEATEPFLCTEDISMIESINENYYVIEKMEYIASADWIE